MARRRLDRARDEKWFLENTEMQRLHNGEVVAIHSCKVWGSGQTADAALKAAEAQQGCPPLEEMLLAVAHHDEPVWIPFVTVPPGYDPFVNDHSAPKSNA
jgi:hypothetical protein